MPKQKLSSEAIQAAIDGFEAQKARIDGQIAELRQMLSPTEPRATVASPKRRGKRRLSASGRAAIVAALKKRWAAKKAAKK